MIRINTAVVLSNRGKSKRTHTTLRCTTCNKEVAHVTRNKRNTPSMALPKYCPQCRKTVETKSKDTK